MQPDGELSDRSKPGVESLDAQNTPRPIVLVTSRDDQAQFADRKLPATALRLERAADAAGWAYHHRWSLVAVPAGYRASNRHKAVEEAGLVYRVGVRLAAWGVRAWAVWSSEDGFTGACIRDANGIREIGVTNLIKYITGETDESEA